MSGRSKFSSVLIVATALVGGARSHGLAQQPLVIPRERVLSLNMLIDPEPIVVASASGGPGAVWRREVRSRFPQGGGFDGMRVHVLLDTPVGDGFAIVVLDAAGSEIDSVRGSS